MADHSLQRADELLTEFTELVETARTLPMSASCVLPREHLLDLLDELRETLPVEMDEARRLVANRDQLLHDAYAEAGTAKQTAAEEAAAVVADAIHRAEQLVHDAEAGAHETIAAARAEHARLVSATGVHQAAARAATELREAAERYDADVRGQAEAHLAAAQAEAQRYDHDVRAEAQRYAAQLTGDADDYADRTLAELAGTLQRAATTAEQGRIALARRREHGVPEAAEAAISA